jgi:deazaflavin-dependent oxidoreductase (nitroreductase family)
MAALAPNRLLRWLFRAPILLYCWRCGWLVGHRFLLLIHIGRRTGRRHSTVLEVMQYRPDGPELIVMSGFGHGADWLRNFEVAGTAEVVVGHDRFIADHRMLDVAEAASMLAGYERRNRYARPIVRRVLSRLVGWRYDGSDEARRRVVQQLPLIGLRPRA